jgi:carboxypeptidase C (cathepsin A)
MLRDRTCPLVCLLLLGALPAAARCQEAAAPPPKGEHKADTGHETLSETKHTITLNGARLEYTATAGTLPLKEEDGKVTANVFFVAYTRSGGEEAGRRPITFAFNGGPGSSSVWLHLGLLGPRRVVLGDEGEPPAPPYRLTDNEDTLLDLTDLVFIDPVTTGYSRATDPEKAKQFHGVQEDVHSVAAFIRLYVTRFKRWDSPKFLAGESYGTTRAAGMSGYLQEHEGIYLNGIALVSTVLNFETLAFDEGNDLPYPLFLPTYTATAWYHKKLPADLQADLHRALAESEKFARGEYTLALLRGDRLSDEETAQVRHKLARYTGLSEDYVARNDLRIDISRFTKELLLPERQLVGRFDSRLKGPDLDVAADRQDYDPSYSAVQGAFTAAFNQYVRAELKYETDLTYEVLTGRVQPWDYGSAKNRYLNVAPTLRAALTKNRDLRVFVANGYYDLATPYAATQYTFDHLGLEPGLRDHVSMGYYDAGHMMYTRKADRRKLRKDLGAFLGNALKAPAGATSGR